MRTRWLWFRRDAPLCTRISPISTRATRARRSSPTSRVDEHHGKIHFTWRLVMPDGSVAIDGRDFGELDATGRIAHIVGFFGPPPPVDEDGRLWRIAMSGSLVLRSAATGGRSGRSSWTG